MAHHLVRINKNIGVEVDLRDPMLPDSVRLTDEQLWPMDDEELQEHTEKAYWEGDGLEEFVDEYNDVDCGDTLSLTIHKPDDYADDYRAELKAKIIALEEVISDLSDGDAKLTIRARIEALREEWRRVLRILPWGKYGGRPVEEAIEEAVNPKLPERTA
jgi:hypothetical protein